MYLDDVVVLSRSMDEHAELVRIVLEKITRHNLKIKISKCRFSRDNVHPPCRIGTYSGVIVYPEKIDAVRFISIPQTATQLGTFLGPAGYYQRSFRHFAEWSACLHAASSWQRPFQ